MYDYRRPPLLRPTHHFLPGHDTSVTGSVITDATSDPSPYPFAPLRHHHISIDWQITCRTVFSAQKQHIYFAC